MIKPPPWMQLGQVATIMAVVSWIYWPAIHGGWLWDDNHYITDNRALTDASGLQQIWFIPGTLFEYYPVTETVQWLQRQLFGNDTFGYHFTNLALHVLNACLFWRLLAKLDLRFGWLGALLFAIHPMNVESVAWISELKNTLSLAPALLCLSAFIDYVNSGERRSYGQALGLFGIAMLCKDSMACLPFCLLLYAWWKRGRIGWGDLKAVGPFFLISVLISAISLWAAVRYEQNHGAQPATSLIAHLNLPDFFVIASTATFSFLLKYLYPFDLVAFYPPWSENLKSPVVLLQLAAFFIGTWLLLQNRSKWRKDLILGFGFYSLNLLPVILLIFARYPFFIWSLDHSAYLPYLGLMGLTVAGFEQLYQGLSERFRPLMMVAMIFLALPVSLFSRGYASRFVDAKGLWIYTLQHNSSVRSDAPEILKSP